MRRWTRRYWVAAAGALALHALLLGALLLGARAPRLRTLRVELIRAPHPTRATAAAPVPSTARAPTAPPEPAVSPAPPRPAAAEPRAAAPAAGATSAIRVPLAASPARSPLAAQAPPASAKAAPAGELGRPAGVAAADRSRAWLTREGVAPGGLSLQLDHLDAAPGSNVNRGVEPAGQGLVREKSRAEQLAEEQATVSRKVEGWLSDVPARDRARTGRDAYWQTLEDALARGFDPGWDMLDKGPEAAGGSRVRQFLEAWQSSAAAYGKSGNPYRGEPDEPGARRPLQDELGALANEARGLDSVSLGGGLAPFPSLATGAGGGKLWTRNLVAMVRITQREDGSLFGVELLGSSGSPAYDRLALGQARGLGKLQLGPPKQGRETLWAFETDFTQIPPVPIAGCSLDDFIPKDCFYPLQKRTRSRVRLQAIY